MYSMQGNKYVQKYFTIQMCWLWEFSFYTKTEIQLGNSHRGKNLYFLTSLFISVAVWLIYWETITNRQYQINMAMELWLTKSAVIILGSQITKSVALSQTSQDSVNNCWVIYLASPACSSGPTTQNQTCTPNQSHNIINASWNSSTSLGQKIQSYMSLSFFSQ